MIVPVRSSNKVSAAGQAGSRPGFSGMAHGAGGGGWLDEFLQTDFSSLAKAAGCSEDSSNGSHKGRQQANNDQYPFPPAAAREYYAASEEIGSYTPRSHPCFHRGFAPGMFEEEMPSSPRHMDFRSGGPMMHGMG